MDASGGPCAPSDPRRNRSSSRGDLVRCRADAHNGCRSSPDRLADTEQVALAVSEPSPALAHTHVLKLIGVPAAPALWATWTLATDDLSLALRTDQGPEAGSDGALPPAILDVPDALPGWREQEVISLLGGREHRQQRVGFLRERHFARLARLGLIRRQIQQLVVFVELV